MAEIAEERIYRVSRRIYFDVWCSVPKCSRNDRLFQFLLDLFDMGNISGDEAKRLKTQNKLFSTKIESKWKSAGCRKERFLLKYQDWLAHDWICKNITKERVSSDENKYACGPGRPQKSFETCSERTKRFKVRELVESRSSAELSYAAQMSVRASGSRISADLLKSVTESSDKAQQIRKLIEQAKSLQPYTGEEALALYIDLGLTHNKYKILRKKAMEKGHHLYPSLYNLRKIKKDCIPSGNCITVDEISASINLQELANHTAERLLRALASIIMANVCDGSTLTLICKWGGDGSSGHSTYKQKFSKEGNTDEFLFVISFVPIQLKLNEEILWQNKQPSSTRLCRPIKFLFRKETEEMSMQEFNLVRDQITNLRIFETSVFSKTIRINYNFIFTMIDGKIANYLASQKSTQSCYICGAKPSEMNAMQVKSPKPEVYQYGLSTLHAWIKALECFLHISYRLEVKKWAIRDQDDKVSVANRKKNIQVRFKNEMGLIVDKPKPGFGTTNDGNTARRFFKHASQSAEITGIDQGLIERFYVILCCLSSGYDLNLELFNIFLLETKEMYIKFYKWYSMPVSVHKILTHAVDVIRECIVPIGQLSEEAQEARNKDCRRFRLAHTRKTSRLDTNYDLFNMLLITSDPLISSHREEPVKNLRTFNKDIIPFLVEPQVSFIKAQNRISQVSENNFELDSSENSSESGDSYPEMLSF